MAEVNLGLRQASRELREMMRKRDEMMTELYKEKVWLGSHKDGFHDEIRANAGYHKAHVRSEVSGQGGGSGA